MRVALLIVAFVLAGVPSAAAGNGKGKGDGLKEAQQLFEAAPFTTLVAQRQASLEEVAAVAAQVEGLSVAEARARVAGGTEARAETAAAPEAAAAGVTAAAAVYCSWMEWQHGRGIFPYKRWIAGQTYWCYQYGGAITYRASNTSARVDGVCSGSNARDWRVTGGAGYSSVVVHHEADFSCATPWWYRLNDTLWMEPAFNSYGGTWMTRTN